MVAPALAFTNVFCQNSQASNPQFFVVDTGKSRFGDVVKLFGY
jgi:hypothetical protein